jgi:glucan phosphoethanolaminetransferase (alkaline phosphatase superfamily)
MPPAARYRLYALGTLYCAPYVAMLVWGWQAYKARSLLTLVLTIALGLLLLGMLTRTWRRFFLVYAPFLLVSVAYVAYSLSFGIVPGHTLAIVLVSATWEEILGLWTVWQGKWLLLPCLAFLGVYLWLAWGLADWPIFSGKARIMTRVLLGLALPVTAFAAQNARQLVDGLALNPVAGTVMFCAGQIPRARAEIHGAGIVKVPYHAQRPDGGEEVHVLVIGESARRGSWSAYGYQRPTTPFLDHLRGAVFLQRAMADANLTSFAVPTILTGMTPEQVTSERPHGTLLDLAKEAGYSTAWLVNQDLDVSTWLGITADRLEYPPDPEASFFGRHAPDEVLLPAYRRELARAGAPRFIGMHIMESHWEYYRRYPPSFQRFGTANRLNTMSILRKGGTTAPDLTDAYDNSVLYTDWFLEQVIEQARRGAVRDPGFRVDKRRLQRGPSPAGRRARGQRCQGDPQPRFLLYRGGSDGDQLAGSAARALLRITAVHPGHERQAPGRGRSDGAPVASLARRGRRAVRTRAPARSPRARSPETPTGRRSHPPASTPACRRRGRHGSRRG